ncbi:Hypothetical predicted protein [Podarcis lilfordi]|uniref:HAT C-terminal dimerisation domain-containing protein n=1 Tax=Podarcis lilfordi TaxID=74358 RepID=A0AA35P0R8_9SAUR|nr:Hypothetical predicted protein [Podarcis lilfordi]
MATPLRKPTQASGLRSSLNSEESSPAHGPPSRRRSDAGSTRGPQLRKQASASSLRSEGQAWGRRSESVPEPDPILLSLVQALAHTGIPLSEAGFFEALITRPLGVRRLLPSVAQLHRSVLPALRRRHKSGLRQVLHRRDTFVFLHEATTGDGRAILGISVLPLDRPGQSPLLLGVEFLEQLSHHSVARAVTGVLSEGHVLSHRVLAVVTSGNAHMIQAFAANGILGTVLPTALHIPCLAHQLELVMELWPDKLERLVSVLHLLEDTFGRQAALRHRYELFLRERGLALSLPVPSRWTGPEAWLEKAAVIAEHLPILMEFVAADEEEGATMAKLQALLGSGSEELVAEATFAAEHGAVLLSTAQFLHKLGEPLAHRAYGELEALRIAFSYHLDTGFGPNTRRQLALSARSWLAASPAWSTCSALTPAMPTLKAVRALDPKQVGAVGWSQLQQEQAVPGLAEVAEVEWFRYQQLAQAAPANVSLSQWWEAQSEQLPTLSALAQRYLWLPLCMPKSPFLPGDVLSGAGVEEGFTDESVCLWRMLRYNRNLC